jgi:hypothetical protein
MLRALALVILLAVGATSSLPLTVLAQQPSAQGVDSLQRQLDRMQRQIDSLRRASERQTERLMELDQRAEAPGPVVPERSDSIRRVIASSRGIYGKPFVRRFGSGTSVGGYVDLEFANDFTTKARSFDQHRLVPFLYSEITDRLHFGTEIEFEHGVQIENADGEAEGAGEISVEFATLDYRFTEALNLRAGVVLSPLGRFNLVHDSPINELTDRPLVARQVIPSTLSEAGAGLFGTVYPSSASLLSYELYLVNGFNAALGQPDGDGRLPIRDAIGKRGDLEGKAPINLVGRVAFSPFLGLELGASGHTGAYGDDLRDGTSRNASIWAFDATFNHGPLDVLGEFARLHVDLDPAVRSSTVGDGRQGFYLQGNYHFGHGLLVPKATSSFTGVVRYDWVDYNRGVIGDEERRATIGLNWRPVPDAAFKSEFQFARTAPPGSTEFGGETQRLVLSLATYF